MLISGILKDRGCWRNAKGASDKTTAASLFRFSPSPATSEVYHCNLLQRTTPPFFYFRTFGVLFAATKAALPVIAKLLTNRFSAVFWRAENTGGETHRRISKTQETTAFLT